MKKQYIIPGIEVLQAMTYAILAASFNGDSSKNVRGNINPQITADPSTSAEPEIVAGAKETTIFTFD